MTVNNPDSRRDRCLPEAPNSETTQQPTKKPMDVLTVDSLMGEPSNSITSEGPSSPVCPSLLVEVSLFPTSSTRLKSAKSGAPTATASDTPNREETKLTDRTEAESRRPTEPLLKTSRQYAKPCFRALEGDLGKILSLHDNDDVLPASPSVSGTTTPADKCHGRCDNESCMTHRGCPCCTGPLMIISMEDLIADGEVARRYQQITDNCKGKPEHGLQECIEKWGPPKCRVPDEEITLLCFEDSCVMHKTGVYAPKPLAGLYDAAADDLSWGEYKRDAVILEEAGVPIPELPRRKIREGTVKKGGQNDPPTTPRPLAPKGQISREVSPIMFRHSPTCPDAEDCPLHPSYGIRHHAIRTAACKPKVWITSVDLGAAKPEKTIISVDKIHLTDKEGPHTIRFIDYNNIRFEAPAQFHVHAPVRFEREKKKDLGPIEYCAGCGHSKGHHKDDGCHFSRGKYGLYTKPRVRCRCVMPREPKGDNEVCGLCGAVHWHLQTCFWHRIRNIADPIDKIGKFQEVRVLECRTTPEQREAKARYEAELDVHRQSLHPPRIITDVLTGKDYAEYEDDVSVSNGQDEGGDIDILPVPADPNGSFTIWFNLDPYCICGHPESKHDSRGCLCPPLFKQTGVQVLWSCPCTAYLERERQPWAPPEPHSTSWGRFFEASPAVRREMLIPTDEDKKTGDGKRRMFCQCHDIDCTKMHDGPSCECGSPYREHGPSGRCPWHNATNMQRYYYPDKTSIRAKAARAQPCHVCGAYDLPIGEVEYPEDYGAPQVTCEACAELLQGEPCATFQSMNVHNQETCVCGHSFDKHYTPEKKPEPPATKYVTDGEQPDPLVYTWHCDNPDCPQRPCHHPIGCCPRFIRISAPPGYEFFRDERPWWRRLFSPRGPSIRLIQS